MFGPEILVRTLSSRMSDPDKYGNRWQYHPQSDHHSKVVCWGVIFDLLRTSQLLRRHVEAGSVRFGINHKMNDFVQDRDKDLDLVPCTPSSAHSKRSPMTLATLVDKYGILLSPAERAELDRLPTLQEAHVGGVLMALEAKACMTAHQRALPRFYDELNSSHQTIHGATDQAIAAGLAMVNMAEDYLSPNLNKANRASSPDWSHHKQPRDASLAIAKAEQLPRRSRLGDVGFDAFATIVIDCRNDGSTVDLVTTPPAPQPGTIYHYATMIDRLGHIYATRFKDI